ncbi:hypothetical protein GGI07_000134 [Coemansia sp. Benny D115]|nr:hypothetical protein GGI07_000134 [Coemansia sp. Benny D115]
MDLTSEFRSFVRQETTRQQAQLSKGDRSKERFDILPPKRPSLSQPTNNPFLAEAYIISKHLQSLRARILSIRPVYLNLQSRHRQMRRPAVEKGDFGFHGVTKLSDPERDEIDRGIKQTIRQMLGKIQSLTQLGEAELERMPATDDGLEGLEGAKVLLKRFVSALDPRKADGSATVSDSSPGLPVRISRREVLASHQSSVIWWLNSLLQKTNKVHAEMQELYLQQKLKREKGVLLQQQAAAATAAIPEKSTPENDEILSHLSPQDLQALQLENRNMVQEFESALDQIRDTQRSVLEISALQTQLANELNAQMQQTERLYNEAVGAVDAVDQGNDYLVSARKHQSTARKWVLIIFIVLSLVLMFLDWFD